MDPDIATCKSRDILASPCRALLLFWLPAAAIGIAGNSVFSNRERTIVWTVGLTIMGAACVVNAMRCRRVHCYLTGPFFLLMAAVSLVYGAGLVPLGRGGWTYIGLAILVGAIAFCCLPEMLWGIPPSLKCATNHSLLSFQPRMLTATVRGTKYLVGAKRRSPVYAVLESMLVVSVCPRALRLCSIRARLTYGRVAFDDLSPQRRIIPRGREGCTHG